MAKTKSSLSGLVNGLKRNAESATNVSGSLSPTSSSRSSSGAGSPRRPPSLGDTRPLSETANVSLAGIQFGRPSNSKTTTTAQTGNLWTGLLKQSASGGIASAFSGGLSSLGGLGGLFSGIMSLFGGGGSKSTPPPLVEFELPNSISQTISISSGSRAAYQVNSAGTPGTPATQTNQTTAAQQLQYQSAAIAQAVKTALLNSSSLNDVIAEI